MKQPVNNHDDMRKVPDNLLRDAGLSIGDRYAIIPALEFDFINGQEGVTEAVVYGVNFGVSL